MSLNDNIRAREIADREQANSKARDEEKLLELQRVYGEKISKYLYPYGFDTRFISIFDGDRYEKDVSPLLEVTMATFKSSRYSVEYVDILILCDEIDRTSPVPTFRFMHRIYTEKFRIPEQSKLVV